MTINQTAPCLIPGPSVILQHHLGISSNLTGLRKKNVSIEKYIFDAHPPSYNMSKNGPLGDKEPDTQFEKDGTDKPRCTQNSQ